MDAASDNRLYPLFVVLAGAGLRVGEACGLRWWDINWAKTAPIPSIVKKAGLRMITPHTIRHSYASYLCYLGTSIPSICKLLGHANVNTTAKYYLHAVPAEFREGTDRMAADLLARRRA